MRPGRWPALHWAISVNGCWPSFSAESPRETHSVHGCTVYPKLRLHESTPASQAACAMNSRITLYVRQQMDPHCFPFICGVLQLSTFTPVAVLRLRRSRSDFSSGLLLRSWALRCEQRVPANPDGLALLCHRSMPTVCETAGWSFPQEEPAARMPAGWSKSACRHR